jgi:hypothetical protein
MTNKNEDYDIFHDVDFVVKIEPNEADLDGGLEFSDMKAAGFLPMFFSEDDERPAYEQLIANYPYGMDFDGFNLMTRGAGGVLVPHVGRMILVPDLRLCYPGDPPLRPTSWAKLRDEWLVLFQCSWLAIIQPDGTYRVHRVD